MARRRKRAFFDVQAARLLAGFYLRYSSVARPIAAELIGRHIVYWSPFLPADRDSPYLAAACVLCFFPSHWLLNLSGVLALSSFIAAFLFASQALVSVWCFFAGAQPAGISQPEVSHPRRILVTHSGAAERWRR
ncbi:MAG: hypothetical protein ABI765_11915 [Gemmatimonadota bacterium]